MTTTTMADHVVAIAQDLFSAMVDGETGLLTGWADDSVAFTDPVHAWVEIDGEHPVRVVVATGRCTADRVTRALLRLEPQEPVAADDLCDALGELANVIGGNLKGLMPEHPSLSLPRVTLDGALPSGVLLWERPLQWHQDPLVISMWDVKNFDGKEQTR